MSYQPLHHQHHTVQEFVPNYVVKSDYLPHQVRDGNESQTADLLRQYEEEKRRGRVFTQRPVEFNPNRYVSFRTYEDVKVQEPISEDTFSRMVRR